MQFDVKIIGFDLDGTLYPPSKEIDRVIQKHIANRAGAILGMTAEEAYGQFKRFYQNGAVSGSTALEAMGIPRKHDLVQEALENADVAKVLNPAPTVASLLKRLSQKYTLDLITGSSTAQAIKKLGALDLSIFFSNIIGADSGSKSSGEAFTIWKGLYPNIQNEQFLYIGDRISTDYEPIKDAGMRSILVYVEEINPEVDALQLPDLFAIEEFLL